jgi:hypothetical protein
MKRLLPLFLLVTLAAIGCGSGESGNDPKADTSKAPPGLKPASAGGVGQKSSGANEVPKGPIAP